MPSDHTPREEHRIAVVGAGVGGTATLCYLAQRLEALETDDARPAVRVVVYEASQAFGPGTPYSQKYDGFVVNMPTSHMSVDINSDNDFAKWLGSNDPYWVSMTGDDVIDEDHPPRHIYGLYLRDRFRQAVEKIAAGYTIKLRNATVEDLVVSEGKCQLHVNDLSTRRRAVEEFDSVVLALGNVGGTRHPDVAPSPHYVESPLDDLSWLERLATVKRVVIAGTNLSGVDVLQCLRSANSEVAVDWVSPEATLPKVRSIRRQYAHESALVNAIDSVLRQTNRGELTLQQVFDVVRPYVLKVVRQDRPHYYEKDVLSIPQNDPITELHADIADAEANPGRVRWQHILDAISYRVDLIYDHLADEEREVWHKKYKSKWHIWRYSMPLRSARRIKCILEAGRVRIGKLEGNRDAGFFRLAHEGNFEYLAKFGNKSELCTADLFLNATNKSIKLDDIPDRLVSNLSARGYLRPARWGGASVGVDTLSLRSPDQEDLGGVYLLGGLTAGSHFFVNAVDIVARHAAKAVDDILFRVDSRHSRR
jgi:uncharacterized NAD(P)/FAD-binding protein YdhS